MNILLEPTGDGSHTFRLEGLRERYHSRHGAIEESLYVYIEQGLKSCPLEVIHLLEVGWGTGLNTLLTLTAQHPNNSIHYEALEPYPIPLELATQLNYTQFEILKPYQHVFEALHKAPFNETIQVKPNFYFTKYLSSVQEWQPKQCYHLVYYDAFGPNVQPEMWDAIVCNKLYEWMAVGGILVTYCAQGQFKRNLKAAGFKVETLPGPPHKREMVRAIKP